MPVGAVAGDISGRDLVFESHTEAIRAYFAGALVRRETNREMDCCAEPAQRLGGTRCPQRVAKRGRVCRHLFNIVFGEADPPWALPYFKVISRIVRFPRISRISRRFTAVARCWSSLPITFSTIGSILSRSPSSAAM